MFLDEELYNIFIQGVEQDENITKLLFVLYGMCDDKKNSVNLAEYNKAQLKAHINKIFMFWDMFVQRIDNSKYKDIAEDLRNISYKKLALQNDDFRNVYDKL